MDGARYANRKCVRNGCVAITKIWRANNASRDRSLHVKNPSFNFMNKRYERCGGTFTQEVLLEEFGNRGVGKYDLETDSSVHNSPYLKLSYTTKKSFGKLCFLHKFKLSNSQGNIWINFFTLQISINLQQNFIPH